MNRIEEIRASNACAVRDTEIDAEMKRLALEKTEAPATPKSVPSWKRDKDLADPWLTQPIEQTSDLDGRTSAGVRVLDPPEPPEHT